MAKSKRPHKHCEKYLSQRIRIDNKTSKLEKSINHFSKEESKEAVKKSCPIGREAEGIKREQNKTSKVKEIKLHPVQEKCSGIIKENFIKRNGYDAYFCKLIKKYITAKICKGCKRE